VLALRAAAATSLVIALAEALRLGGPLTDLLPRLCATSLLVAIMVGTGVATLLFLADQLGVAEPLRPAASKHGSGAAARLAWVFSGAVTSLIAFAGLRWVQSRYGSPITHSLAVGLATPPFLLLAAFGAERLRAPFERLVEGRRRPAMALAVGTLLVCAVWGAALAISSRSLLASLDLSLPLAVLVLASLALGAALSESSPLRAKIEWSLAGLSLCLGLAALALEPDGDTHQTLQRSSLARIYPRATGPGSLGSSSPSCWPGTEVQAPDRVADADAPDVVLLTVDALRWDHTDFADPSAGLTPRLLKSSESGVVFERAYAAATATGQSFRVIFTGLLPGVVDAPPATPWGLSLAPDQVTLASWLEAAGYQTTAILTLPKVFPRERGGLRGFDRIEEIPGALQPGPDSGSSSHAASYVVDRIIGQLAGPSIEGPRFVWAHLPEPHSPYFDDPYAPEATQDADGRYRASIRYVDRELARLLSHFSRPGRAENTTVILTADHGEARGEHGFSDDHGNTLHEEEVHVPLVIWAPGAETGRNAQVVSLADLMPTIADLALAEETPWTCGRSLGPAIRGDERLEDKAAFMAALPEGRSTIHLEALLQGTNKFIVDHNTGTRTLFDLAKDPRELQGESSAEAISSMEESLRAFIEVRNFASDTSD
jgi:arylsulfatase A-like enzyme